MNSKGLHAISSDISSIVAKIQNGESSSVDMRNGTFTISNVGAYGSKSLSAIVSPMQACSLGVGVIEKRVVPNDGSIDLYCNLNVFSKFRCCCRSGCRTNLQVL